MSYYTEKQKKIPVVYDVDVVVAGGGCAGTMAAVAAARNGANTLLIERYGFLGGAITSQYVPLLPIWNLTCWGNEEKPLIGGLAQEICVRLERVGGSIKPEWALEVQNRGEYGLWFNVDFELTKLVKQEMCEEAGVKIILHTYVADAIVKDKTVKGVLVENKSGRQAVIAKVVVDATGDGDVAARAGAAFEMTKGSQIIKKGGERPAEYGIMATSSFAKVVGVDFEKLTKARKKDPNIIRNLMKRKAPDLIDDTNPYPYVDEETRRLTPISVLPEPYKSDPKYWAVTRPGWTDSSFVYSYGQDITDAKDLTEAELETRRKIGKMLKFYKENVPGYKNAYIATTPTQLGLRESRHITGDYILTEKDMFSGATFDDVILRNRLGEWDVAKTRPIPPPFDIPYRCVVPRDFNGLLVAGRCISITHQAALYYTPRDIGSAWGLGEAAGTAAALCAKKKVQPRKLDIRMLQAQLRAQGCLSR